MQVILSTGSVTGGASAFVVNWTRGLWFKCFCQLDLWVVDQVLLSTGLVDGDGSSTFVNWACMWWMKCFCQLDL